MVMLTERIIMVGLGEICVTNDRSSVLACLGLGSCIGLCAYDSRARVAGMAHIVLPESNRGSLGEMSTKYADIAIPRLLEEMGECGAVKPHISVKLVGGAQMIQNVALESVLQVGKRNLEMTINILAREGIRLLATDTGGNFGRSVQLSVDSGKVMVRVAGGEYREL